MPRCLWIFSKPGEFPVHRCGEAVGYRMVPDDDGRPRRKYFGFCPDHMKAAEEMERAEELADD